MPDQPEGELSDPQQAEVRRLLAEARHTEPVPPEVADRLDRVLGELASEPVRKASVVRLARRRRRAASMLVAAAAVVVGGVAVGQVIGNGGDGGEASTTSEEAAGQAESGDSDAGSEPGATARDDGLASVPQSGRVVRVRPREFAADVAGLQARSRALAYDTRESTGKDSPGGLKAARATCEPGDWGSGRYQAVRYGRATGYVVFRRPQGDTQVADLFLCGSELAVRSVTLPSR